VTAEAITPHLLTNLWVIRRFLDREIQVEGSQGMTGRIIVV
jgi:RNA 3'-terminal phosphate cyclase